LARPARCGRPGFVVRSCLHIQHLTLNGQGGWLAIHTAPGHGPKPQSHLHRAPGLCPNPCCSAILQAVPQLQLLPFWILMHVPKPHLRASISSPSGWILAQFMSPSCSSTSLGLQALRRRLQTRLWGWGLQQGAMDVLKLSHSTHGR